MRQTLDPYLIRLLAVTSYKALLIFSLLHDIYSTVPPYKLCLERRLGWHLPSM